MLTQLLHQGHHIGNEKVIKLSEALKSNSTLTLLDLACILLLHIILSLYKGNNFGNEEAFLLSEALKSNSSLTELDLSGNRLVVSFYSHSTQWNKVGSEGAIKLYETPLLLHSISVVTELCLK
jgi:hypothetical protein